MKLAYLKIVIWISVSLVAVEFALEVRAMSRGWDTLFFGSAIVGERVIQKAGGSSEFGPTPSFPFRSRIVPITKSSGDQRYWIASSSHAEDSYLQPTAIFPVVLDRTLNEEGLSAVVLNASRAGNDISANVEDLKRWGPQWNPDYVILYQMSLTVGSISKKLFSGNRGQKASLNAQAEKTAGPISWVNKLVESTTIYANVKGQIAARVEASRVLANDLGIQGEQEYAELVHQFIRAARGIGAAPILTTFATSHTRQHLGKFPEEIALLLFRNGAFLSVEGWVRSIERFNEVTRQIAGQEGVMLIDVASEVSGQPEYFRDFVHFTPEGHKAVARTIKTALMRMEPREVSIVAQGQRPSL